MTFFELAGLNVRLDIASCAHLQRLTVTSVGLGVCQLYRDACRGYSYRRRSGLLPARIADRNQEVGPFRLSALRS